MNCLTIIENKFDKHYVDVLTNELINYVNLFNISTDVLYKNDIYTKIKEIIKCEFLPKCRFCGNIIINSKFKIYINKKNKYIQVITPIYKSRTINNIEYNLSCCEKCLLQHFSDNAPRNEKYYFMKANKYGAFSYGYPENIYKEICKTTVAVTLKSMQRKWGDEEGKKRWDNYCKLQAEVNTFEYKSNKYGWTKEQFELFNKSRAVTKENLIKKYGEIIGEEKWNNYIEKQKLTKSYEYMVDKYGEDKAKNINKSKALILENYINKYGENIGYTKYIEQINKHKNYYSKSSQKLFNDIDNIISNKYTTYYATKGNGEFGIMLKNKHYIKLDFYIKELNICIEFNGTHFHGDPRVYNYNDTPNFYNKNQTAKEIWEKDYNRYKELENYGIKTYIIWELDYNENFNVKEYVTNVLNINI